jgi:hypothetical protein
MMYVRYIYIYIYIYIYMSICSSYGQGQETAGGRRVLAYSILQCTALQKIFSVGSAASRCILLYQVKCHSAYVRRLCSLLLRSFQVTSARCFVEVCVRRCCVGV